MTKQTKPAYTKEEAAEVWMGVRKLLVEFEIMKSSGESVKGHEKICKAMRRLILVDSCE